ncbi:hypothetical protein SAMD00019534_047230 [Acytostelium subglobosum LB1]|uniref:hypothetical protein n=1 Tax=Acytostelium subglobosum LB1 TaxID=1410327 RepID=UPI000644A041|nr:hypothetical protein SAMD00019534_047230 [Acytostelium subglobosum LB1]GAM21548.1 hypothetical protein SAMD00019534_047230 [Acytostelium subglobosum LB1]|eukprot:XP_012755667.1 hypothetical protein SAMD00019534_047230 [Acytostelium subglobosum LB1]
MTSNIWVYVNDANQGIEIPTTIINISGLRTWIKDNIQEAQQLALNSFSLRRTTINNEPQAIPSNQTLLAALPRNDDHSLWIQVVPPAPGAAGGGDDNDLAKMVQLLQDIKLQNQEQMQILINSAFIRSPISDGNSSNFKRLASNVQIKIDKDPHHLEPLWYMEGNGYKFIWQKPEAANMEKCYEWISHAIELHRFYLHDVHTKNDLLTFYSEGTAFPGGTDFIISDTSSMDDSSRIFIVIELKDHCPTPNERRQTMLELIGASKKSQLPFPTFAFATDLYKHWILYWFSNPTTISFIEAENRSTGISILQYLIDTFNDKIIRPKPTGHDGDDKGVDDDDGNDGDGNDDDDGNDDRNNDWTQRNHLSKEVLGTYEVTFSKACNPLSHQHHVHQQVSEKMILQTRTSDVAEVLDQDQLLSNIIISLRNIMSPSEFRSISYHTCTEESTTKLNEQTLFNMDTFMES